MDHSCTRWCEPADPPSAWLGLTRNGVSRIGRVLCTRRARAIARGSVGSTLDTNMRSSRSTMLPCWTLKCSRKKRPICAQIDSSGPLPSVLAFQSFQHRSTRPVLTPGSSGFRHQGAPRSGGPHRPGQRGAGTFGAATDLALQPVHPLAPPVGSRSVTQGRPFAPPRSDRRMALRGPPDGAHGALRLTRSRRLACHRYTCRAPSRHRRQCFLCGQIRTR